MELNLAVASTKTTQQSFASKDTLKARGSWKKRHRENSLRKAKERRLQGITGNLQLQSKAKAEQADEFSSGVENPRATKIPENAPTTENARSNPQKRSRDSPSLEQLSNVAVEGVRAHSNDETIRKPAVRKRPRTSSATQIENDRPDQKPEAVSAALAVIGTELPGQRSLAAGGRTDDKKLDKGMDDEPQKDATFATTSFEETGLYQSIAHHLVERMDVKVPTKVQEKLLKTMLSLKEDQQCIDVLVRSPTGSGKTLAYLLPVAHYLLNRARRVVRKDGALAVIIVPTRELADQVEEVAERLFRPWHWIVTSSVVGGESKRREKARLRKGVNVLVGTPGRLLDHMRNTQSFLYGFCEFLILDEADRLLDLGFEEEVEEIIGNLNKQAALSNPGTVKIRSNVLLSATLRKDVEKLAKYSLQDPVEVSVRNTENENSKAFSMPQQLKQHFCIVEQKYRLVTLACFLRLRALKGGIKQQSQDDASLPACKTIVFFSTCDSVDFHFELFKRMTLPPELRKDPKASAQSARLLPLDIYRIHGNHSQSDRVESLRGFRQSHRAVLFCTDVAARGLDLKGLTFAIQYDPPTGGQGEELEYFHRAGRTARIGARGDALLFLLPSERAYVSKLESKGVSISEISSSAALAALNPKVDLTSQNSISYSTRLVTSALQESFETIIKDTEKVKHLAVSGFQSYCRAYATHAKEVRYFFHVRNLHLGHVARAFSLSDKPAELSEMMAEIKKAKADAELVDLKEKTGKDNVARRKRLIARAIAGGEAQPYNDQSTELAKRRREKGRGQEAFRELAMEFGS